MRTPGSRHSPEIRSQNGIPRGKRLAARVRCSAVSVPGDTGVLVNAPGRRSPLLWAQGKPDAVIRLEQLWDDVGKTFEVDILCGYAFSSFTTRKTSTFFRVSVQNTQPFVLSEIVRLNSRLTCHCRVAFREYA